VVSGGVREEERKVRQHGDGAPTGGPKPHSAGAQFKLGMSLFIHYCLVDKSKKSNFEEIIYKNLCMFLH
jgi:hypothetical protein